MHSRRMRIGRSLTVCWRLLPGGGGCGPGRVSASGGVWSGGGPVLGGSAPRGVPGRGGLVPRGCLLPGGYPSMH